MAQPPLAMDPSSADGVDGYSLELKAPGGSQAVISLFRRDHIVPGATHDPATWTDEPFE
jgi:hypothetical protein